MIFVTDVVKFCINKHNEISHEKKVAGMSASGPPGRCERSSQALWNLHINVNILLVLGNSDGAGMACGTTLIRYHRVDSVSNFRSYVPPAPPPTR